MSDEPKTPAPGAIPPEDPAPTAEAEAAAAENAAEGDENDSAVALARKLPANEYFHQMMDRNFLDYASYVIGSRAIPDVDDGLKPVQRRILWTLYEGYDNGRTTKSANVIGNAMHYHPHGDASICDALTVLANKGGCINRLEKEEGKEVMHYVTTPYFIKREGNFGNPMTGTPAAAPRYTECALTRLAYETMFNNDITAFIPNYDGRRREPVQLPAKVPSLLMLGSDGIAVGMSTVILPHNFNELIDAEIAELEGREFHLYPDFPQGGVMDVRDYDDGNGRITLRAKIEIEGRELVIREIPATCTTASLIASIERAADKNKIRISSIDDFTTDHAEIRITPTRGYDPEKTRQGLFMYTDCSVSVSPKLMVICDRRPVQMSVTAVLKRNVRKLLGYLKREFEIELERLNEQRHAKTLAQLFFENRIYKRIEECATQEAEYEEVLQGLAPFRDQLERDVTRDDVDKLLALPVRRIARFDIEKNQKELREIAARIKEVKHLLKHLVEYAVGYLQEIKRKYGAEFPRRTEIEQLEKIDRAEAALNNVKVGWDRGNGHLGTQIKSDDIVLCNEFDHLLCVERSGKYKIIDIPDKMFIGRLYDCRRYDPAQEFGVIYSDKKSGKWYGKRMVIDRFITAREYQMLPANARLELFTPRADAVYTLTLETRKKAGASVEINLMTLPTRSAKARGMLIPGRIAKLTHSRYLEPEETAAFRAAEAPAADPEAEENAAGEPVAEPPAPVPEAATVPEPVVEPIVEPAPAPEPIAEEPAESRPTSPTSPTEEPPPEKPEKSRNPHTKKPAKVPAEPGPVVEPEPVVEPAPEPAQEPVVEPEPAAEPEASAEVPRPTSPTRPTGPTEEPAPVEAPAQEPAPALAPAVPAEVAEDLVLSPDPEPLHRAPRAPRVPKPPKKDDDAKKEPGDDLGIVQPELGF